MFALELRPEPRTRASLLSPQCLPNDAFKRFSQPTASLISADALQEAETIGDIYALPFPLTFTPLLRPELIIRAYDIPSWDFIAASYIDPCAPSEMFQGTHGNLFEAFHEVISINNAFNNAAANFSMRHPKVWSTTIELYKSALSMHGVDRHFDFPEARPQDVLMHVSSSDPGYAVAHDKMPALLHELDMEHILGIRLDDPELIQVLQAFYERITNNQHRDKIFAYMSELPSKCANILTGVTVHTRPVSVNTNRVFSKAITKFEKI